MKKLFTSLHRLIFFRLTFLQDEIERVRTERDAEIERLRFEVRTLMDTLLKANHLPAISPKFAEPLPAVKGRMLPSQFRRAMEAKSGENSGEKDSAS